MMTRMTLSRQTTAATLLGLSLLIHPPPGRGAGGAEARDILAATGVKGGLVVHLGCGDGKLTAALRAGDSFVVHGLDTDAKRIAAARQHIQSLGLYGRVSAEQWTGQRLPYAGNLVNLLVVGGASGVTQEEMLRVLAPNGVAYFLNNQSPMARSQGLPAKRQLVKPRPKEIDEWTHFLHDAGNNAVARDTRVGAPRRLQWTAPPPWLRSHETPSGFEAMVAGGGRVCYYLDEGLIGITDQRLPERWSLVCRDAFNGKLLWKRPVESWGWPQWAGTRFQTEDWTEIKGGRTVVPDENQRRIVADGDRLYATLAYRGPLIILDAATGKTLATVTETAPARQIIAEDGVAVVYSQTGDAQIAQRRGKGKGKGTDGPGGRLVAVAGATGAVLWQKGIPALRGLSLAINRGRVICQAGGTLLAVDLKSGKDIWQVDPQETRLRTLVATDGTVVLLGQKALEVRDGATGRQLWHKQVPLGSGLGSEDLFVINGTIWPGMLSVDEQQQPAGKSPHVLAIGYALRTGEEQRRIFAQNLRSPEHHHRCYRNKATENYLISSMEGAEFLNLCGTAHTQNNFVRGACKLGFMPCNGMLYVPPDQCFCQPGAKMLGFTAIAPVADTPTEPVPDSQRLVRGPAFGSTINSQPSTMNQADWPTFRHDAARHGSTPAAVRLPITKGWRVKLGSGLTQPVVAGDRVLVASREGQTLHVLDLRTGQPVWTFVAGGRIDSPPTVHEGSVLMGSADGWVYCLRAADGALVWRFRAAPWERRIIANDQLESAWPVHGSVLVRDGIAYFAAGRSTYLDGGIRVYGLEAATGKIAHQTTLSGPFPDGGKTLREVSFYIQGANSDVLVSEGNAIYLRQKRLTLSLKEEPTEILSTKGETDVGRHVFSTSGLLDGSWYNRAFWMYARRWPGFQLANQAPKSGQLVVVDGERTYAVNPFYRRNLHSPMFFPAKEGYLLFADKNTNEPQIVGDKGSRKPIAWLPQSDYTSSKGLRTLDSEAFGLDKMIGYTRAEPPVWSAWQKVRVRALVKAGDTLFAAGPPDVLDAQDPYAAFEGRKGAKLFAVSAKDGKELAAQALDVPPVFDGMIAARGRLLVSLEDGSLECFTGAN